MTTGVQFTRHYRKVTLIFSFAFLCCLSSHMSWFAWMKLILGPLVLEAYKFKLKWVIWRVGLSEVCRSPDAKSCHSHLPLCPRMASCRGSNLSETLRCPDIAHNRLNLRLPITAQILSSSKVHRGHPGILLLTASSSTICICQSLKILEELNYEYFTLLQYAKSGWKYPFAKTTRGESCQPVVKYLPKITTLELFSALVSMPAGSQCFR